MSILCEDPALYPSGHLEYNLVSIMKPIIEYTAFDALDLRVGEVVEAAEVVNSRKLLKLTVDFGPETGKRTVFAGLVPSGYTTSSVLNKKFIFLVNLKPKKIMEEESEGMMLAGDVDHKAIIITVPNEVPSGTVIR